MARGQHRRAAAGVGRHGRIVELEAALRGLVARVDRAGGYAGPEEQDVLRRARRVLG